MVGWSGGHGLLTHIDRLVQVRKGVRFPLSELSVRDHAARANWSL
jgi:hypothetical protein